MSDGIARLVASLEAAATSLADPADLLKQISARVATEATSRAPRRTGALAGSLSVAGTMVAGRPTAELTWGVRYAAFVNYGTRYMRAQPFATDALAAAAADAEPLAVAWAEEIVAGVRA
jgi:HK97 gp10 family phage protein